MHFEGDRYKLPEHGKDGPRSEEGVDDQRMVNNGCSAKCPNIERLLPSSPRPTEARRNAIPQLAVKRAHEPIRRGQRKDQDLFRVTQLDGLGEPYDPT